MGQEVFLRPLPAPSVCSLHFLYPSCGAACAWLRHGTVPKPHAPVTSSPGSRAGHSSCLRPVAHGPGAAAHGSGWPARARGAVRISLSPQVHCPCPVPCSALRTGSSSSCRCACTRCHGCSADGASPAAAVTSLLPVLLTGREGPSGSRRAPGISRAWGASLRGKIWR